MHITKYLLLAAIALFALRTDALASDTTLDRQSLVGVKAIHVLIESLEPEIERDGLTESQLQTDVELRLRQSGIVVVDIAVDTLYVNVNALRTSPTPGYAYNVQVEFEQPVTLKRTGATHVAGTWSAGTIGTTPIGRFSESVRSAVRDEVDRFINAFLSVNPKP